MWALAPRYLSIPSSMLAGNFGTAPANPLAYTRAMVVISGAAKITYFTFEDALMAPRAEHALICTQTTRSRRPMFLAVALRWMPGSPKAAQSISLFRTIGTQAVLTYPSWVTRVA